MRLRDCYKTSVCVKNVYVYSLLLLNETDLSSSIYTVKVIRPITLSFPVLCRDDSTTEIYFLNDQCSAPDQLIKKINIQHIGYF